MEAPKTDSLKMAFQALHLKPQMFYRSELTSPWAMQFSVTHGAAFHVIQIGEAWLHLASAAPLHLAKGDLIVVSNMAQYAISSAPDPSPVISTRQMTVPLSVDATAASTDDANRMTIMLWGEFRPERDLNYPLFALMPPLIHIKNEDGQAVEWLLNPLNSIAAEATSRYPGFEVVISHLMDILFIMVIRYWIVHHMPTGGDWLRALYHPQIGAILTAMHSRPAEHWTVEALAQVAHLSRSTFSAQFTETVGEPPMKYLTRWRMQLAMNYLSEDPRLTVEGAALRVGYDSSYAFSKTFKRVVGLSPSDYRRDRTRPLDQIDQPSAPDRFNSD